MFDKTYINDFIKIMNDTYKKTGIKKLCNQKNIPFTYNEIDNINLNLKYNLDDF